MTVQTFDLEPLAAAAFAIFVFLLMIIVGIGARWRNLFVRTRKNGFPITRRLRARRKAS